MRNLLIATADRAGFKSPVQPTVLNANVAPLGVAGIALTDIDGNALLATQTMPPLQGNLRDSVRRIPTGSSGIIDIYAGVAGDPTIGFVTPVFAVQGGRNAVDAIGMIVAVRLVDRDLFNRLIQPGETEQTAETYLIRANGPDVEYLSPLKDGISFHADAGIQTEGGHHQTLRIGTAFQTRALTFILVWAAC